MKATVIGSINYDIIISQARFGQIGETCSADNLWSGGGGKGANQAVQLAKLGIPTTLIGAVGNDVFGELLIKELASYGVNTDCINVHNGSSGMGIVTAIPNGEVKASIVPGANITLLAEDIDKNLITIQNSDLILYQMEIPIDIMEYSFNYISKNAYIILNASPVKSLPITFWSRINCFIVNEVEASFYSGITVNSPEIVKRAIAKIRSFISKDIDIIVTLGKLGCVVSDNIDTQFIQALPVKCIESTGAGDSFIGAFSAYYLNDPNIFKAAEYGTKAASITVQGVGAQVSMPNNNQMP